MRLLDVGCGDGNVTIPAARAAASVTALDLTRELLDAGRARARREGVSIDWILGDAEELPLEDESFDAVTSNFGAILAPRHRVAVELARVCRPRGTIVLTVWAPDGFNERLAKIGAPTHSAASRPRTAEPLGRSRARPGVLPRHRSGALVRT